MDWPSSLDDKTLMLKTSQTLAAGHKETDLELSRNHARCLAFMVLEGAKQAAGEETVLVDLPRAGSCMLQY